MLRVQERAPWATMFALSFMAFPYVSRCGASTLRERSSECLPGLLGFHDSHEVRAGAQPPTVILGAHSELALYIFLVLPL